MYTKEVTICERHSKIISCNSGTITITSANYGRTDRNTCGTNIQNTTCYANRSLAIVQAACNGRKNCTLRAVKSVFGDPCIGIVKYLSVSYSCSGKMLSILRVMKRIADKLEHNHSMSKSIMCVVACNFHILKWSHFRGKSIPLKSIICVQLRYYLQN